MSFNRFSFRFFVIALGLLISTAPGWAQSSATVSTDNSKATDSSKAQSADQKQATGKPDEVDPLKRPLTEKEKERNAKAFKHEVSDTYKKWLNEDVRYIITPEEEAVFKQLSNDEERDQFIEQFWLRRDPTPDTPENEFKEEHYRRIAYANEHFAAGIPGWKTDRGRMYIMYGPPDEIESHPSGGTYERPIEEGGGTTSTYPFEDWRYRYIEGIGQEVIIEFVDDCQCGAYEMTMDRSKKDALLYVPNAGLTFSEQMGQSSKNDRFSGGGLERLGLDPGQASAQQGKEFDRLEQFFKLQRPPEVKFKELDEIVSHKIRYNLMPFDVHSDFVKITSDTVLVPITIQIQNKDITFENKDGVARGLVNIYGRVSTITSHIVQTFEDPVGVDVPGELLEKTMQNHSIYWKALPLRPGHYRVDIVVKDVKGDRVGTWTKALTVPEFSDDKLASSSLILADVMEKVPAKSVGAGNFVIGDTKVRPRVEPADGKPASFKRDQKVNFWMQVYNLGIDGQSKKPSATIEYDVVNTVTNKAVAHMVESTEKMGNIGDQITLEKSMPLTSLPPGTYRLTIKVNDNISKQTITPSANFAVE
ncbi:MAG TPA: GWxTD domain-containing protein [Terriglobales bacterium]|nr:GWxTD domain-containing protein [Terriglobales bacterium]